jgi:hypothetical protein
MDANYRVTFRGDPIGVEAAQALDAAGLVVRASHGVGTVAPGGALPAPNHHSVYLHADSGDEALQRIERALNNLGTYVAFEVEPFEAEAAPPWTVRPVASTTVQLGVATEVEKAMPMSIVRTPPDQSRNWKRRWDEAQRELNELVAPRNSEFSNEAILAAQHELHSFFVQTYHIRDALIADAVAQPVVDRAITNDPDLALLADLANLDKHFKLNRPTRSGAVPVISVVQGIRPGSGQAGWTLEMKVTHHGKVLDGLDIARRAVAAWRRHLKGWGLI